MVEKIPDEVLSEDPFISWELRINESFDLKELYIRLHEFLIDWDFVDLFSGGDDYETRYYQKTNEDNSLSHIIWWRAKGYPRNNAAKNIAFYIQLDIYTVRMSKVEQMISGKKVTLDKGEIKLKFKLYMDINTNRYGIRNKSQWDTHPILKHFKRKFWDRINRETVDTAEGDAIALSRELHQLVQTYTGARLPQSEPKDFLPIKGVS